MSSVGNLNVIFGLNYKNLTDTQWRKKSIFFELSYWKDNLICHNLDLIHIEKNVGEILLKWLDALKQEVYDNAKEDIKKDKAPSQSTKCINIQRSRHPLCVLKLHKYHQISSVQRKAMCVVLGGVKILSGYSSNIARCFNSDKIGGLKSHGYHVLMQQLLLVAIHNVELPK